MQSLGEYIKIFESEAKYTLYKKMLEVVEGTLSLSTFLEYFNNVNLYVNIIQMINEFSEFLPISSYDSLKLVLKDYLEDRLKIPIEISDQHYEVYKTAKINMEGFYKEYRYEYLKIDRLWENEAKIPYFKINWSENYREVESIIFDNITYTFKLSMQENINPQLLHFWNLDSNYKQKLTFVSHKNYLDISNPEFKVRYFYVLTSFESGETSKSEYFTFLV